MKKNLKKWMFFILVVLLLLSPFFSVSAHFLIRDQEGITSADAICVIKQLDNGYSWGFEDGLMPPPNWTLIVTCSNSSWEIVDTPVHSGNYAAMCQASIDCMQDEQLISPPLNLIDCCSADLKFWAYTEAMNLEFWNCEVIIQGHGIYDVLWDVRNETDWTSYTWRAKVLDLSPYCGKIINITWRYSGGYGANFGLDDIRVSCVPPPPPLIEIDIPSGFRFGNINVTFENVGLEDGLDVQWNITLDGGIIFLGRETSGAIPLFPYGEKKEVSSNFIVGFGRIILTVSAFPSNGQLWTVKVEGFVFGPFIVIQ